ncbi:MAG: YHYH protein [Opitutus sp.]|nr:YHYH protein [Opitutus sp.]
MKTLITILLGVVTSGLFAHPGHEALQTVPAPTTIPEVTVTVEGTKRVIRANGIPDHATGRFPGRGNPNKIAAQRYEFSVPVTPQRAGKTTPLGMSPFGVAVNGVVFDPGANEWWNDDRSTGWQYEALGGGRNLGIDPEHAHVQPNGAYHYHGMPGALLTRLTGGKNQMVLVGWAADGFPIYGQWIPTDANDVTSALKRAKPSYRVKAGNRPDGPGGAHDGKFGKDWEYVAGTGDLDECNGRTGKTPEFPTGTYYYVLTDDYPFVSRLWRGTPDASFIRRGPPPGGGPDGGKGKKQKRAP